MSAEQIVDLIINYAYTRKEEIEKHTEYCLALNKVIILLDRLMMKKLWKLTIG
jgi:hypothetical protein